MNVAVRANAKINLTLDVTGKRDDGYHLVEMVMQSISLHDTVTVSDTSNGRIMVSCNAENVPENDSNIAVRAAREFFQAAGLRCPGLNIKIKKRIPVAAGLAGGSADGAAVIIALNELLETNFSEEKLCMIGEKVGADLPFCLTGGTMLAKGTGGILSPLPNFPESFLVLAKPDFSISTAEAYSRLDRSEIPRHPHTELFCEAICAHDIEEIAKELCNVFEYALAQEVQFKVEQIKKAMRDKGAAGACMSGSGPTVFALFEKKYEAQNCADELERLCPEVFVCTPVKAGYEIC